MAWVFVLGVILGSFYNVLIIRTLNGESIIFPPSHCMSCDTSIEWKYKIPILSYLFLKGKCKYCGANISTMYPIVELLTGLIFVFLYAKFGLTFHFFMSVVCVSIFLILAGMDIISTMICSKYATFLVLCSILFNYNDILNSIYGGVICFGIIKFLLFVSNKCKKEFIGDGDLHLFTALGCFVGMSNLLFTLIFVALFSGMFCVVKFIKNSLNQKDYKSILYLLWFGISYFLTFLTRMTNNFSCLWLRLLIFVNLILSLFYFSRVLIRNLKKSQGSLFMPISPFVFLAVLCYMFIF